MRYPVSIGRGTLPGIGLYENNIATLMQAYKPDLARIFTQLDKHLDAADLSFLREIVIEIQQRIDRFNKGF